MKTATGFTLIELLIVMMVMGVALSLVGPATLQQFSRAETISDRERLFRIIEQTRFDSFVLRQAAILHFNGRRLTVSRDTQQDEWDFEHLSFPEQTLRLNAHGFWQQQQLNWLEQEKTHSMQLNPEQLEHAGKSLALLPGAGQ